MDKLNIVQELRLAKNMSIKELSKKSNVSVYLINRIENYEIFPLQTTMLQLCYALDEKMTDVFNFDLEVSELESMLKKPKK